MTPSIPGLPYAILLAKAAALRFLPERNRGITPYYRQGFQGRLAAAESQLRHHGPTKCLLEIGCGRDLLVSLVAAVRHGKQTVAFDVAPLADEALAIGVARVARKRLAIDDIPCASR